MSNAKKRSYNSESRQAGAKQTKTRILAAAKKLFTKHGFEKVTIEELAAKAGVSAPTIFSLFRSKRGVLTALMNVTFFGDRYEELVQKAKSADNPVDRLRMAASIARTIYDTEKSQMGLIRGTSALSPELKELERVGEKLRYKRQEMSIRILAKEKLLAYGLDIRKARDIFWALTGRDIYRMLVMERGWSSDAYEKWLEKELVKALIRVQS